MPISIFEIRTWLQGPTIFVLDCAVAEILFPYFTAHIPTAQEQQQLSLDSRGIGSSTLPTVLMDRASGRNSLLDARKNDTIVLAACATNELLPTNPLYPADLFTSCLTTPIPTAVRLFIIKVSIFVMGFLITVIL